MRAILLASATVATCGALAGCEIDQPRTQAGRLLGFLQQYGMRSLHEEFSQIFVPASGCSGQLLLASGGVLTRNHPHQAANPRPFLKAAPLPMAAMIAVAVTGPTPGMVTNRRQASFSRAICAMAVSDRSIFSASCASSSFSSVSSTSSEPDSFDLASARVLTFYVHL